MGPYIYRCLSVLEAGTNSDFNNILGDFVNSGLKGFLNEGLDFIKRLLIAVIILVIGKKLIHYFIGLLTKYFNRTKMEASVAGFLQAMIRAILYITLAAFIIIQVIGVASAPIIAILGSAGLSIGLALQGSLSNFAGGVLILLLKPFRVGDYIITGGNEGTVTAIDIFYTRLLTVDNRLLVMPNGSLSNANIINVTYEPVRRLDISVLIDYSENIKKVKDILTEIAENHELVLKDQDISVFVNSFDSSAINIGIRVWVIKENYWTLKCELLELIKTQFDKNEITIPFDQLDVNIRNNP
ncbi:mechanosensitive ion channel family protein [Anaerocolumna sp. MB42-C2]|uniref:mechanosensitive ion channel family protein n=1 Tax=Anaerocolumna sp. MB42-C2 TaxID=3070997 RepID=UPI0027DFBC4B|nr:mechanosensitive ion channel domain-containing protein [Anaerocolumna sp. MB42-C2]WMJ88695.1 mechanosensitive ion channel [Anaerocolumna sp. MB42-C2]